MRQCICKERIDEEKKELEDLLKTRLGMQEKESDRDSHNTERERAIKEEFQFLE